MRNPALERGLEKVSFPISHLVLEFLLILTFFSTVHFQVLARPETFRAFRAFAKKQRYFGSLFRCFPLVFFRAFFSLFARKDAEKTCPFGSRSSDFAHWRCRSKSRINCPLQVPAAMPREASRSTST
jgi:hypothetical protein